MRSMTHLLAGLAILVAVPAQAEEAPEMTELQPGEHVSAHYRSKDRLKVFVRVPAHKSALYARELALEHMARMTQAKGFDRFAVTKLSSCGSMVMTRNGTPISGPMHHQCRLLGEMLRDGEQPKKVGNHEIKEFTVAEALERKAKVASFENDPYRVLMRVLAARKNRDVVMPSTPLPLQGEGLEAALPANEDNQPSGD